MNDLGKEICSRLSDYFDGEMEGEDRRRFERHLETCPACGDRLEELKGMREALRSACDRELPEESDLRIRRRLRSADEPTRGGEEILDLEGVARLLKVTPAEVEEHLDEIPSFEIAGRLRFRRDRIIEWVGRREMKRSWEKGRFASTGTTGEIIKFPGGDDE